MDKKIICCVFVLLGSVFFSSCDERQTASKGNDGLITATVTGKERVVKHDPEGETYSYYLVYTDKEVFKIEDSLLFGQFNSSDVTVCWLKIRPISLKFSAREFLFCRCTEILSVFIRLKTHLLKRRRAIIPNALLSLK